MSTCDHWSKYTLPRESAYLGTLWTRGSFRSPLALWSWSSPFPKFSYQSSFTLNIKTINIFSSILVLLLLLLREFPSSVVKPKPKQLHWPIKEDGENPVRPWVLVRLELNSQPPTWQRGTRPTEPPVCGVLNSVWEFPIQMKSLVIRIPPLLLPITYMYKEKEFKYSQDRHRHQVFLDHQRHPKQDHKYVQQLA